MNRGRGEVGIRKLCLEVDRKQESDPIRRELDRYSSLFYFEPSVLGAGDYLLDHQLLIKRKRLPSFLEGIKSGRLFQQAHLMSQTSYQPVMIIEGNKADILQSQMKREAIQGTLIRLMLTLGIPVLRARDSTETARLINYMGMQISPRHQYKRNRSLIKDTNVKLSPSQRDAVGVLLGIPGIGCEKAIAVMEKFQSLRRLFNADADQLQSVKGIGPKLAENIHLLMNCPFGNGKEG